MSLALVLLVACLTTGINMFIRTLCIWLIDSVGFERDS